MTGREYASVAARHSNLVATKSGGNPPGQILGLLRHAPDLCHFMTEQDFAMASLFGDVGLLISVGAMNPRRTRSFFDLARRRELAAVSATARELSELVELAVGSVASGAHMDGAYDKMYVKAALPDFPLRLLPPYQGASDGECDAFLAAVRARLPQWMPNTK
jgi:dihydrodipicolinate synthase/N-acetylneuraminate lyase